ncbi:exosortase A [Comamonadaceae bacterium G21597-S1]|nr:exosortase A [Comamonadaceae bacterium G21597-S1]
MPQPERQMSGARLRASVDGRVAGSSNASAWRAALLPLFILIILIITLYRDTAMAMITIWYRSETFTHGFVVLPISMWLIWRRRSALAALSPRPNLYFVIVFGGLALTWLLGDLVAVNSVTQFALVAMMVASVPAVLGFSVATSIAFPLAFMFFAVPIGEFVMPQLMDWTADFTILALRLSGIPVYREGLNFVIPTGNWSVVEACSGVRYLIASLTVGTLYAYLNYQSTRRRLLFVLVSILVPVVANWLRAYMIVMLGHLSGNTIAVGADHLIYGWVFFGVVILLMFMIGARWSEPEYGAATSDPAQTISNASGRQPSTAGFWLMALLFAAMAAMPMFAKHMLDPAAGDDAPQLVLPDTNLPPWQAADAGAFGFKPHFLNPSAESNRLYASGDKTVGVYLAFYRGQNYERKLVTSTNVLVPSSDKAWSQVEHGAASVDFGGGLRSVRFAELRRMGAAPAEAPERLLAWQIYWIHGHLTSSDYLAKVYSAAYQLLGRGDDSAVLVFYTPIQGSGDARETLASFVASHYGRIDEVLEAAAAGGRK